MTQQAPDTGQQPTPEQQADQTQDPEPIHPNPHPAEDTNPEYDAPDQPDQETPRPGVKDIPVTRYDFSYVTIADGVPTAFSLGGHVAEDVAVGIKEGLTNVPTITDVIANQIKEHAEEVTPLTASGTPSTGKSSKSGKSDESDKSAEAIAEREALRRRLARSGTPS